MASRSAAALNNKKQRIKIESSRHKYQRSAAHLWHLEDSLRASLFLWQYSFLFSLPAFWLHFSFERLPNSYTHAFYFWKWENREIDFLCWFVAIIYLNFEKSLIFNEEVETLENNYAIRDDKGQGSVLKGSVIISLCEMRYSDEREREREREDGNIPPYIFMTREDQIGRKDLLRSRT